MTEGSKALVRRWRRICRSREREDMYFDDCGYSSLGEGNDDVSDRRRGDGLKELLGHRPFQRKRSSRNRQNERVHVQ